MSLQLISDTMAKECEALIGLCFAGNRLLDRIKAELEIRFVMPITSNIVHLKMAHQMPLLADEIGDYLESRNYSEGYPMTMADFTVYNSSRECFDKILDYYVDLEQAIIVAIDKAIAENDKMTMKFLHDFLLEVKDYTAMALTLVDVSECYGSEPKDNMQLDSNIKKIMKVAE